MSKEDYWQRLLKENGKLYWQNVEAIKDFFMTNRGYVYEIPQDETLMLLYSGGMDSTILIDILIQKWNCKIILLYIRRDAKNQKWEEQAVDFFYQFYKNKYPNNILEIIKLTIQIPTRVNKEFLDKQRQKFLGLPLRNATMWNYAFQQAVYLSGKYKKTIRTLAIGSIKEDETSPESGILSILSGTIHTCICMGVWYYQIMAPFLDGSLNTIMSKLDIIKYSQENQIPIEKSRSCFEADAIPCGKCLACENRNKAYEEFKNLKR